MSRPGIADVVAPFEDAVAVVYAIFKTAAESRREVQFAGKAAGVSRVGEHFGDESLVGSNSLAQSAQAGGVRIPAGEETRA